MRETNLKTAGDEKLDQAAKKLLEAAMDYWREYRRVTGGAAVAWLKDTSGRMVVLTRGEYQATLMQNIDVLEDPRPFDEPSPPPPRATEETGDG